MEEERPWAAPAPHVVVGRRWKYAPPPRIMYQAVAGALARWPVPLAGGATPRVAAAREADAVLLKPWTDQIVTAVELWIEPDGYGSAITVLAYGAVPRLPD